MAEHPRLRTDAIGQDGDQDKDNKDKSSRKKDTDAANPSKDKAAAVLNVRTDGPTGPVVGKTNTTPVVQTAVVPPPANNLASRNPQVHPRVEESEEDTDDESYETKSTTEIPTAGEIWDMMIKVMSQVEKLAQVLTPAENPPMGQSSEASNAVGTDGEQAGSVPDVMEIEPPQVKTG
ncbi:unnamed protein product [Microthlaspi erraticum]|uniref:Uncharacterized protein n=1 Tax=Microthlaspi erraticum TaxID=1685480 RepID=A0A6D2KDE1_9BRAS|nr:unnamed protein product [Microthlaspi erraticum]